jgi:hypothetical protein
MGGWIGFFVVEIIAKYQESTDQYTNCHPEFIFRIFLPLCSGPVVNHLAPPKILPLRYASIGM